jgi:hypothetical protein
MPFGIPKEIWTVTNLETGELNLEAHHQWIAAMRTKEKSKLNDKNEPEQSDALLSEKIGVPSPMEIVMGGGRNSKSSIGYLCFCNVVEQYQQMYEDAARLDKFAVNSIILRELHTMGCRFVKCTSEGLVVQPDGIATEKISHAFRNFRATKTTKKGRETGTTKRGISET